MVYTGKDPNPSNLRNMLNLKAGVKWERLDEYVTKDIITDATEEILKEIEEDAKVKVEMGAMKKMVLKETISAQYCPIGRGTSVIHTELEPDSAGPNSRGAAAQAPDYAERKSKSCCVSSISSKRKRKATIAISIYPSTPTPPSAGQKKYAFKISWKVESRLAEIFYLIQARKRLPKHI